MHYYKCKFGSFILEFTILNNCIYICKQKIIAMLDRIKLIIESKKINAAQFAEEIGVQRSALSHVLSGRNNPSLDFMLKIKNRYPEINLDWLLIGSGTMIEKNVESKVIPSIEKTALPLEIEFPETEDVVDIQKKPVIQEDITDKTVESVQKASTATMSEIPSRVILLFENGTFDIFENKP